MALPPTAVKILNLLGLGTTVDPLSEDELRLVPGNPGLKGLVTYAGDGFLVNTGSGTSPISLPELRELLSGSFSNVLIKSGDDIVGLAPEAGVAKYIITSNNGAFQLEPFVSNPCFSEDDISDCASPFVAGLCATNIGTEEEPIIVYCLTKIDAADFDVEVPPNFWADTSCIKITGQGTPGDPYKATLQISPDEGNTVECRENGLFGFCCDEYGDPLGDLV